MDVSELQDHLVRHGATETDLDHILRESDVMWQIRPDDEVSDVCIHLTLFMSKAAENAGKAVRLIDRMRNSDKAQDDVVLTALKKYVEDTCEAIKVVDDALKNNETSLDKLVFEVPDKTSEDEMSWRNLIGRRIVIAHRLLTVDNSRVYREAVRDFGYLHALLSKVHINPVKTDLACGQGPNFLFKTDAFHNIAPAIADATPGVGASLVVISEDKQKGLYAFRIGRTENSELLFASTLAGSYPLSVHGVRSR